MSTGRTARARRTRAGDREDRKAEASELLATIRGERTKASLADAIGVSETKLAKYEDPEAANAPPPLDAILVADIERDAVRVLAERAGMVAIELPDVTGDPASDLRMLAEVQRETSDVVRSFLAAIEDGRWTRHENAEVRAEAWQAVASLARLIRTLETTAHEPVMGVRRDAH